MYIVYFTGDRCWGLLAYATSMEEAEDFISKQPAQSGST
jgi:hypothetical protein